MILSVFAGKLVKCMEYVQFLLYFTIIKLKSKNRKTRTKQSFEGFATDGLLFWKIANEFDNEVSQLFIFDVFLIKREASNQRISSPSVAFQMSIWKELKINLNSKSIWIQSKKRGKRIQIQISEKNGRKNLSKICLHSFSDDVASSSLSSKCWSIHSSQKSGRRPCPGAE